MSWPTVVWAMGASACLTLSAIHLVIGLRRLTPANFLVFATGLAVATLAGFELALMKSPVPEEHARLLRWVHVPIAVIVICLVLFVWTHVWSGRRWLGWMAIGGRALCLVLNFLVQPNFNYSRISGVRPVRFLGETIFLTVGTVSPRGLLGLLSSFLLIAFLADATGAALRRRERRPTALVGASITVFMTFVALLTFFTMQGVLSLPFMISLCYLGVVAAMGYELGFDVIRVSQLGEELKASEVARRESEKRMSLAAAAAGVEFWHFDASTGEYWISEKGRSLRGFGREERIDAQHFFDSVHPEDREPLRAALESAIRKEEPFEGEYRVVGAGGETVWVASRGSVEAGPDGRRQLRGTSADVTRRKVAELEVVRNRLELAHLSRVTLLGELSGSLAHEINQPLAAILANAQAGQQILSGDGRNSEEIREIFADIVAADTRASEVIRRLRALLKKGEVELKPLRISEVVQDALDLLRSDLLYRRVNVFAQLPRDLPAAIGDRTQIQQVVVNLVTNACDAMDGNEDRERWLSVRAAAHDGGLLVAVGDRGPGFSAEESERLFDPFFTTKPHGLGLGLAVCRTIVSAHGGRLWAMNNPAGGATFQFTLRAQRAANE
jgi:two-component system, LuxR family, sensor kinase FixL